MQLAGGVLLPGGGLAGVPLLLVGRRDVLRSAVGAVLWRRRGQAHREGRGPGTAAVAGRTHCRCLLVAPRLVVVAQVVLLLRVAGLAAAACLVDLQQATGSRGTVSM